jgi:uncharacterized membrane protein HdeD (DUF308 family)
MGGKHPVLTGCAVVVIVGLFAVCAGVLLALSRFAAFVADLE